MGNGGSKPESSDGGVIQAGLHPIRRRFEEIRRRRKQLHHRDSIVSTTELLPATADSSSAAAAAASSSDIHKEASSPVLVTVPESDVLMTENQLEGEGEKNRGRDSDSETLPRLSVVVKRGESAGEDNDLFYGRDQMPKSPSFRHLAEIGSHLDHSDESGGVDDHQAGKVQNCSEGSASSSDSSSASRKAEILKKKKGRKLPSFARGPAVCGLLHVQSCYSVQEDSPRTKPPAAAAAAADHDSSHERDRPSHQILRKD